MSKNSLDYFHMEAEERLERLSSGLMSLEQSPADSTLIADLFREAHSLKGAAGVSGLTDVSNICHKMEDFLGGVRDGSQAVSSTMIDACLAAADAVARLIASAVAHEPCDLSVPDVLGRFDVAEALDTPDSVSADEKTAHEPTETRKSHSNEYVSAAKVNRHERTATKERTSMSANSIQSASSPRSTSTASDTIRLRVDLLESLSYRTGELMIAGDRLGQRLVAAKELLQLIRNERSRFELDHHVQEMFHQINTSVHRLIDEMASDLATIEPLIAEVHEQVLDTRMLPLGVLFDQLPRFVRDYCREENTEADLLIEGADIRVDRQVLEQLRDPLIHLIRNSLSHGLESPDIRRQHGKSPIGKIRLITSRHGERIRIVCEDDGRGINREKVQNKAVAQGLVAASEAVEMSDEEIYRFALHPGFSTAEMITDVSGRGVGMDVVLSRMEALRGTLEIESEPQQFTRITLEFPASVATLEGLLVEVAQNTYIVPMASIICTQRVELSDIQIGAGGEALVSIEEEAIPLLMLEDLLGCENGDNKSVQSLSVVVIRHRNRRVALGVDRLLGTQTIVGKGLGDHLRGASGVAGATILGTGIPALVLDTTQLVQDSNTRKFRPEFAQDDPEVAEEAETVRILVVDDSLTTRTMEKSILESAGYNVDTAADAEEALTKIQDKDYRLFVCDVEMPGLNGFQLTRKIRQEERFAKTPVVIVSSLASEKNRRDGLEAGANAYITKGQFDQNNLIDTVERLVCR